MLGLSARLDALPLGNGILVARIDNHQACKRLDGDPICIAADRQAAARAQYCNIVPVASNLDGCAIAIDRQSLTVVGNDDRS
jgi:hypothetical protein